MTFTYKYPNYIPLGPQAVGNIAGQPAALGFDRLSGAFTGRTAGRVVLAGDWRGRCLAVWYP